MGSSDSDPKDLPPRIGLTTYVEEARWGVWDRPAALLPHSYVEAVVAAGGVPVLLPPGGAVGGAAETVVRGLDALILTGGDDVGVQADRDSWEIDLLHRALDAKLPVLAICRGAQVLNVAFGGTLHQHLPDVVGHDDHRPEPAVLGKTPVRLAPGTLAAEILGMELTVPCYHHQAIDRLGAGVDAVGWADDGTVEAAVLRDHRFALAVQWHPEDSDDLRLFQAVVGAAGATHGSVTRMPRPDAASGSQKGGAGATGP
ncbi:MAG TPA: gamma-glutamyl-gamma-aminobutyrate hydrolase family protein [Acidimicrobiales bacterium]